MYEKKVSVDGRKIIIKSNKPIEGRGVLRKIAEYAASTACLREEIPSIEAIISLDFFEESVDVSVKWLDSKNAIVKIRQKK